MKFSNSRNQCNYLAGFAFFVELAKAYPFAEFLVGIDLCGKKRRGTSLLRSERLH